MSIDKDIQRRRFEELGEPQVRDTAMQWQGEMRAFAYEWLREQEAKREEQRRLEYDEQLRTARSARTASIVAAIAAAIVVPLTVAAIVISYLAWRHPHL